MAHFGMKMGGGLLEFTEDVLCVDVLYSSVPEPSWMDYLSSLLVLHHFGGGGWPDLGLWRQIGPLFHCINEIQSSLLDSEWAEQEILENNTHSQSKALAKARTL